MEELEKRLAAIEKAMEEEAAGGSEIELMGLKSNKLTLMVADEWMNECPWVYDTRLMWQSLGIAMRGGIAWISGHHHWKVKVWLSKKGQDSAELSSFSSSLARIEQTVLNAIYLGGAPRKAGSDAQVMKNLGCQKHFCSFPLDHSHQSHFQQMKSSILHALRTRQLLLGYRVNGQRICVRIATVQIL